MQCKDKLGNCLTQTVTYVSLNWSSQACMHDLALALALALALCLALALALGLALLPLLCPWPCPWPWPSLPP